MVRPRKIETGESGTDYSESPLRADTELEISKNNLEYKNDGYVDEMKSVSTMLKELVLRIHHYYYYYYYYYYYQGASLL